MAAIKPNKYPNIYEFNYKPRNYESQKNTLKSYKKERIYFREKESKKVPSFNQPRPKSSKV